MKKKLLGFFFITALTLTSSGVNSQSTEDQAVEKCYKTGWYWNGWMLWYGKHEVPCLNPSPTGPPSEDIEEDTQ